MALRQAARSLAYPFLSLGRGYDSLARNFPQSTAIITTTIKTSAADAFAQLVRPRATRGFLLDVLLLTHQIRPCRSSRSGRSWTGGGMACL